jgi:hypothetical protein
MHVVGCFIRRRHNYIHTFTKRVPSVITFELLLLVRSQFTMYAQNVFHLNQFGMDTSDHGQWQPFKAPGAVTNHVTDIKKNDLLQLLL